MSYLWMALAGLLVGAVAKLIIPGKDPGGILVTMLFGIIGTFIGNGVRSLLSDTDVSGFNFMSISDWLFSVGGAIVVILLWKKVLAPMFKKD